MRQKPFRLFSRVALVLLMMMLTATSAWATITGSGTEADPYVINTEDDWNTAATTMQYYYNSSYVYIKLGADLNFSGKTFNMYGSYDNKIRFDGQGYTISGITIEDAFKGTLPYFLSSCVVLMLLVLFPNFWLAIPATLFPGLF